MLDIATIVEIIRKESTSRLERGTVIASDPRGTRNVAVRLSGGRACSRPRSCVEGLEPGDEVVVATVPGIGVPVILAKVYTKYEAVESRKGPLAPPDNLSITPVPAALCVRWDSYPGEDLCWQVRYNSSASDTDATDVLVTRGSYYLHWVVDGSGDMDTAAQVYFRVRALRWIGDNNVMFSAWSAWGDDTSGGHNLREVVELEFENAAELTIDGAGAITRTQVYHTVDTAGDAATDDLDTINGGTEGDLLIIRAEDGGHTVVIKHDADNIWLLGKADLSLNDLNDHVILVYSSTNFWCDVGGGGGGGGGVDTFLELTDTPGAYAGHAGHLPSVNAGESALQWIAAAGWLGVSDVSELAWQPDAVAVLHLGRIYEYADPDDAFTAAVANDIILIPPGTWTLSALHTVTNVSVVGLGGGPDDCVLQSTIATNGALVMLQTSGVAFNISVDWDIASSDGKIHRGLYVKTGCSAYFCKSDVNVVSGTSQVCALWVEGTARQCIGSAHGNEGGVSALSTTEGNIAFCEGEAETDGDGDAIGLHAYSHAVDNPITYCVGIGTSTGTGAGYGLYFGGNGDVYVAHCYFDGSTYDVTAYSSAGYFYSVRYESEFHLGGSSIVHMGGDRAGKARNETITGNWAFTGLADLTDVEFADATELTINAGVITRVQTYHKVDTAGDDPTDDLNTINGGTEGDLLVIRPEDGARTVVVKHNTGNIWLLGQADVSLDDADDHIALVFDGAKWSDIGGGGGGGFGTTDGQAANTVVSTDANAGIRPKRLGVGNGTAVPGFDGQVAAFSATQPPLHGKITDVNDAAAVEGLRLTHELTAGTAAAGFGTRINAKLEDSLGNVDSAGSIDIVWEDATHGSEDSAIVHKVKIDGNAPTEADRINETGLVQPDGFDIWPNGEQLGFYKRKIHHGMGLTNWVSHFRTGDAAGAGELAGYAWQAGAFGGVPIVNYCAYYDFFAATSDAYVRHFMSKAVPDVAGNWQNKFLEGRFRTGAYTQIGLRIDDGTDDNYAEIYMTGAAADATQRLCFRFRAGGGAVVTRSSNLIVPCDNYYVLRLKSHYGAPNYSIIGYLGAEEGDAINVLTPDFSTGIVAWAPSAGRAGIMVTTTGNFGYCDWFQNELT